MNAHGCADEEVWVAEELWRERLTLGHERFVSRVVMLLRAAQRDGRGALKPRRRAVLAQEEQ